MTQSSHIMEDVTLCLVVFSPRPRTPQHRVSESIVGNARLAGLRWALCSKLMQAWFFAQPLRPRLRPFPLALNPFTHAPYQPLTEVSLSLRSTTSHVAPSLPSKFPSHTASAATPAFASNSTKSVAPSRTVQCRVGANRRGTPPLFGSIACMYSTCLSFTTLTSPGAYFKCLDATVASLRLCRVERPTYLRLAVGVETRDYEPSAGQVRINDGEELFNIVPLEVYVTRLNNGCRFLASV